MIELPSLVLAPYAFRLRLQEPLHLPPYKGGVLRGGFGITFKRTVCIYKDLPPCESCALRRTCPYPAIFEPSPPPDAEVLRKHDDIPLPFVMDAPADQRTLLPAGSALEFRATLFGRTNTALPYFIVTFQRLGEIGLGADRSHFSLERVGFEDPAGAGQVVVLSEGRVLGEPPAGRAASALAGSAEGEHLTLHFLTPTRLKYEDRILQNAPPFHVVIRTLLRRLSSLSYFHGGQRWVIDYRGWIERARAVETTGADVKWVDWERYSTRQQQRMNLGGIVGRVTYEGDLGPFLPLLRVGELIHVGKNVVFGHGQYRLAVEPSDQG